MIDYNGPLLTIKNGPLVTDKQTLSDFKKARYKGSRLARLQTPFSLLERP